MALRLKFPVGEIHNPRRFTDSMRVLHPQKQVGSEKFDPATIRSRLLLLSQLCLVQFPRTYTSRQPSP
jgi:hypothetical protein